MSCEASYLRVALHRPLLPRHLVEIAVVEHEHDRAAGRASACQYLRDRDQLGHAVHLHRAVADERDRRPVRDARTSPRSRTARPAPSSRGCPRARPSSPCAIFRSRANQFADEPESDAEDRVVGQPLRELPEEALRVDRVGVLRARAPPSAATSRATLALDLLAPASGPPCARAAGSALAASPARRRRGCTSIG